MRQLQRWGRQPIIFAYFPQKLHEFEEIWTERGARVLGAFLAFLDPPMSPLFPKSPNAEHLQKSSTDTTYQTEEGATVAAGADHSHDGGEQSNAARRHHDVQRDVEQLRVERVLIIA